MVKDTITVEDRVLEYTEDTLGCTSQKFQARTVDWRTLFKNRQAYTLDASWASGEKLQPVLDEVEEKLKILGFGSEALIGFYISIWEALHNAQRHTLDFRQGRRINLDLYVSQDFALVGINARGKEYDILRSVDSARTAQEKENLLREGGRGTYLMAVNCDLFYVSKAGEFSEVLLGKFIS